MVEKRCFSVKLLRSEVATQRSYFVVKLLRREK